MEKCLSLLEYAISAEDLEPKTKVLTTYDPIRDLTDRLQARLEKEEMFIEFSSPAMAMASSNQTELEDPRTRYSFLVTGLLNQLCDKVEAVTRSGERQSPLFSAKQLSLITSVLQFFVATSVAPYLDKGVGNEVESRSKLVKQWLLIDCAETTRKDRLRLSALLLLRMAKLMPELMSVIIPKFLSDLICANEQLINFGNFSAKEEYEQFIRENVDRDVLMYELFSILNRSAGSQRRPDIPTWFQLAVGRRLSELIIQPNGLYHLTTALTSDGGHMFDNHAFVQQLAKVLSTRPLFLQNDEKRRPLYYGNVLKQFLHVMQSHPMAEYIANWFSATVLKMYEMVPRAVDICIFDTVLHPWELLSNSLLPAYSEKLAWNQRLDASLKTFTLYVKGLPPFTKLLCFDRLAKLFPLWLQLYGCVLVVQEKSIGEKKEGSVFLSDLGLILRKILEDPAIESNEERAAFIVKQFRTRCFHMFGKISAGLKEKSKVEELIPENSGESEQYVAKYGDIELYCNRNVIDEIVWLNRIVTGVVQLLQDMEKTRSQPLLLCLLSQCIQRWRRSSSQSDTDDVDSRFLNEVTSLPMSEADMKMRVQYLMGHFGGLLASLDLESTDVLLAVVDVAKAILESACEKVSQRVAKESFDVVLKESSAPTKDLKELEIKSVEMAVALISGTLLNASKSEKFLNSLTEAASTLEALCGMIAKLSNASKLDFAPVTASGEQLLDILKTIGIVSTASSSSRVEITLQARVVRQNNDQLDEVYRDLDDQMEPVKGHGLILLARLVRKRDKAVVQRIENKPEIMKKVLKHIVSSDSYVYLAAINAMAELAYWKRYYFDMVVDFFINPIITLQKVAAEEQELDLSEAEKKDFLVIQRIKVGEALAKVCRALGDMAAWHFERLINPLLFMVKNTRDGQLKASCLCALADLVLACKGRGFHGVLNEMLMMIEQFLIGGREPILRRASMTLLRAIIVSFDTEILTGLSSQLLSIHRQLRRSLLADRDDGIRLLAELCLLDIKEQMNKLTNDLNAKGMQRIRIS